MAWDTVANVVSDAAIEMGLASATIADPFASTDPNILQLLAHLKSLGRALVRDFKWSHLQEEYTFATVASTESYALPTGFASVVDGTFWNRAATKELVGPASAREWQALKAQAAGSTSQVFRIWQDLLWLYPTPTAPETVAYEYTTGLWVAVAAADPTKDAPTLAADVLWLDRDVLVAGLQFVFLKKKGFPEATGAEADFGAALARARGGDGAAPSVVLSTGSGAFRFSVNLAETGHGL